MKTYRLKKWYPSLPINWEVGDIVHQSYGPHCYSIKNKNVDYRINVSKEEVENNPEFWEEVVEYPIGTKAYNEHTKNTYTRKEDGWYKEPHKTAYTDYTIKKGNHIKIIDEKEVVEKDYEILTFLIVRYKENCFGEY